MDDLEKSAAPTSGANLEKSAAPTSGADLLEKLPTELQVMLAPALPWLAPCSRRWAHRFWDESWLLYYAPPTGELLDAMVTHHAVRSICTIAPHVDLTKNFWLPALASYYDELFVCLLDCGYKYDLFNLGCLLPEKLWRVPIKNIDLRSMPQEAVENQTAVLAHILTLDFRPTAEDVGLLYLVFDARDTAALRWVALCIVADPRKIINLLLLYYTDLGGIESLIRWMVEAVPAWGWLIFRAVLGAETFSQAEYEIVKAVHAAADKRDWPRDEWRRLVAVWCDQAAQLGP